MSGELAHLSGLSDSGRHVVFTRHLARHVGVAVILVASACSGSSGESDSASPVTIASESDSIPVTSTTSTPTTSVATSTITAPPTSAWTTPTTALPLEASSGVDEVDIACFGTRVGLSCLGPEGWQNYNSSNSPIYDWVSAVAICPDGTVVVPARWGVAVLRDGQWSKLEADFATGVPSAVACTRTGEIWVGAWEYVGFFADGEWTSFANVDVLGESEFVDYIRDIRVAPDGTVWVLSSSSVAQYDNGQWTVWEVGSGIEGVKFVEAFAIDDLGDGEYDVYASAGPDAVSKLVDGQWVFSGEQERANSPLAVRAGTLFVGSYDKGIVQIQDDVSIPINAESGLSYDIVRGIAIDRAGRQWVGTEYGVTVLGDGQIRVLRVEDSGLLDNEVNAVATLGNGPSLPAEEAKASGGLSGTFVDGDGTPIAGIPVEACVLELRGTFDGETPCSDHPFFAVSTTDDNGTFTITGLPPGRYSVALRPPEGWTHLLGPAMRSGFRTTFRFSVSPGATLRLGTIELVLGMN